jgi:hypothetical protein
MVPALAQALSIATAFITWRKRPLVPVLWNREQIFKVVILYPVEAGLFIHPEDYPYSSARHYIGEKGYLDVVLIE